jgi:hypothetical protein
MMTSTSPESPPQEKRRVTFNQATRPPQETAPSLTETTTSQQTWLTTPITAATIDKPILNAPTPRVRTEGSTMTNATPTPKMSDSARNEVRDKIRNHLRSKTMTRIPQRKMYLRWHTSNGQSIQLVHDPETNQYLNYRQLIWDPKHKTIWSKSAANELRCLAQGVGDRIKGTDTIRFITKDNVPYERWKDVMYGSFTCDVRPHKDWKEQTRLTAGGDSINYLDNIGMPTVDMTLIKCLANSIISTPGARCIMLDIKDYYLNTPMKHKEYMRLKITDIPDKIIKEYNWQKLVTEDGYVYCAISKDMYCLPQAGIIAQELFAERLSKHGYNQSKIIPGLWTHKTIPTMFTLIVDVFAIKIMSENNADHIINALK